MAKPVERELVIGRKNLMSALQICNWDSVERLIKRENLPAAKVGGRWLARREALIAWINQRTKVGPLEENVQRRAIRTLEKVESLLAGLQHKDNKNRRARWKIARKRRQLLNF